MMRAFLFSLLAAPLVALAASEAEVVKVKGVGTGDTEQAALKDAYRDAVESAVGMYIDAEQMVKNDALIKDEILTQSNAYIEDYDVIDKQTSDAGVKIKILARVRKQALTKKIEGAMAPKSVKVGKGLKQMHAQMTTSETKGRDGAALLSKALEGVDPLRQLMDVSLASTEAVLIPAENSGSVGKTARMKMRAKRLGEETQEDEMVELAYLFKFEINKERYFRDYLPNLERVLAQVSDREPREIVISAKQSSRGRRHNPRYANEYFEAKGASVRNKAREGVFTGTKTFESSAFGSVSGMACMTMYNSDTPLDVVVVTEANESMTTIRAKTFSLDTVCATAALESRVSSDPPSCGGRSLRETSRKADVPTYNVLFLDAAGKTVTAKEISIARTGSNMRYAVSCENIVSSIAHPGYEMMRNNRFWFITPFIGCDSMAYYQWCTFKIPKEDMPKIDSIKIELAQ